MSCAILTVARSIAERFTARCRPLVECSCNEKTPPTSRGFFRSWSPSTYGGVCPDRDVDVRDDVGVQRDGEWIVADLLERPGRHANHRSLDLDALRLQRIDDVDV